MKHGNNNLRTNSEAGQMVGMQLGQPWTLGGAGGGPGQVSLCNISICCDSLNCYKKHINLTLKFYVFPLFHINKRLVFMAQ